MTNHSNNLLFIRVTHEENTKQIPLKTAQLITGRSAKTLKRWINGQQQPDDNSLALLKVFAFGLPPLTNPGPWDGFFFKQKGYGHKSDQPVLVTPYNEELTAHEVNSLVNTYNLNDSLMKENQQLKDYVKKLEDARSLPKCAVIAFEPYLRRKEYINTKPNSA